MVFFQTKVHKICTCRRHNDKAQMKLSFEIYILLILISDEQI